MFVNPSVSDFKSYFVRDFPYGATLDTITDTDITNAMQEAGILFNPGLWENQQTYTIGYLLLSAHFLVTNIRGSSQGLSGQFSWIQSSKAVGSVSESYSIPDRILANPEFAMLSKTTYGARYLFLILPLLSGQIFAIAGATHP